MHPDERFSVGGVWMPRPFKIRRLGHFGLNVAQPEKSLDFYSRLLGFDISDRLDFAARLAPEQRTTVGPTHGIFLRHGTDHHSFVLFPRQAVHAVNPHYANHPELTVNQITWQVGTLQEVVHGNEWFKKNGLKVLRSGRDLPGSNWHFYPPDPEGHINELYYGIEQIGWSGHSKSHEVHTLKHHQPPQLPQASEFSEVNQALAKGLEQTLGWRRESLWPETHDVGGVLLARPFKVVKVGPVRLFVDNLQEALDFYQSTLGLAVTEEVTYQGHRCVFLRANTEHHAIALYPKELRHALGRNPNSSLMSFGIQLGSYQQLLDAYRFLAAAGVSFVQLPSELSPGLGHNFHAIDPDGHLIQVYWSMDQIGWDGQPRPASSRPIPEDPAHWPSHLSNADSGYSGEVFLGPLN